MKVATAIWCLLSALVSVSCAGRVVPSVAPTAAPLVDYRSRTIYFIVTDRFNPRAPFAPYVDPKYPDATNRIDCFTASCTTETEFRKYWGGDIAGIAARYVFNSRSSAMAERSSAIVPASVPFEPPASLESTLSAFPTPSATSWSASDSSGA